MKKLYDLVIVGGGPAGLSAAITAASDGLGVLLVDSKNGLGGQAKSSSRVENYPGFPEGISGTDLTGKFASQAARFGVEYVCPQRVTGFRDDNENFLISTDDGEVRSGRSILLALGLSYRRLETQGIGRFIGRGVRYFGTPPLTDTTSRRHYFVVGGANSAGQAALHVAMNQSVQVTMVIRSSSLEAMSRYLSERIKRLPNITVLFETEVVEVRGAEELSQVVLQKKGATETQTLPADGLFVFIGAQPKTYWLRELVALDERGYILTGNDLSVSGRWVGARPPFQFETSKPGVFAAGDVCAGSTKRVASACGSGTIAVQMIRAYLALE